MVATWPPCSLEQLLQMASDALKGQLQGLPVCRPPQSMLHLLNPPMQALESGLASRLPDQIDLAQTPGLSGLASLVGGADGVSPAYRIFRWSLRLSPISALLGLLLLVFLAAQNLCDLLAWLGGTLLAASLLALLGLLLIHPIVSGALNALNGSILSGLAVGLVQFWIDLLRGVMNGYFDRVTIEAVVLLFIGLLAIGGALIRQHQTIKNANQRN